MSLEILELCYNVNCHYVASEIPWLCPDRGGGGSYYDAYNVAFDLTGNVSFRSIRVFSRRESDGSKHFRTQK